MTTEVRPLPHLLSVRAIILRPIFDMFDGNSGTLRKLLARHGLDSRVLEDDYAPVPLQTYLGFFEDAAVSLDDPNLGLRLGASVRPGGFGPMGLRATQCATIYRGLESLVRFTSALQSGTQVTLEEEAEHVILRYMITASQVGPSRQDNEFTLAGMCSLIRKGYDLRWRPLEVHFSHPPPDAPGRVERWFDAPVLFSQATNMLVIDPKDAHRVYREEDPDMLDLIDRHLASMLERAGEGQSASEQVRALIALYLGAKPITLETIAPVMQTSRRSLQRRLAEEGTTLKELLRSYRQERAEILLTQMGVSVEAVASTLGYADGTSFWRAFKSWTGRSPSKARRSSASAGDE
ncbi:AraC family transcriptional regulator [Salipiger sp. PrR002]|uniref:AraC family transcriptional regulator n=1 Tax=Salipiger sp. PrR002 TaxID=2706489 RepID=UPI0013B6C2EA|nr:AraC family transcriptional regulator [Salipiger sp. PrR002]NDW00189.1 AraC family transcriptional regulator [Salipiger sp. PrR002]NDW56802.1 AraC family transcriptional regulator [Salipiger sp. PrR004]